MNYSSLLRCLLLSNDSLYNRSGSRCQIYIRFVIPACLLPMRFAAQGALHREEYEFGVLTA